ncbi:MerR family transcriptional regulator [Corynebacterium hylobatis]|uniref:MerR family transcriptional regulator n=1 Tax=Corynebacterium hylobatis TaxID=1859290 RepID=A0A430I130_9CORY|nr:MerR family transcriptional regulator [Corynebacterium hylobatis]RSZ65553.1 MerR family transcriptional regulator [Corynebacterium hylobatis]
MTETELMPIGVFARRTGLTASALRFYDDAGLLPPADVDPHSGYRRYGHDQIHRAKLLRELREISMPLTAIQEVFDAPPEEAGALIDAHAAGIAADARAAQARAAAIKDHLGASGKRPTLHLRGPVLAEAIEQVFTATGRTPDHPALSGVYVRVDHAEVSLTATDRYRLTRRTLIAAGPSPQPWSGVLDGEQLRWISHEVRHNLDVAVELDDAEVTFRVSEGRRFSCRVIGIEYPDFQLMLDSLSEVRCRVVVPKHLLLRALESVAHQATTLSGSDDLLMVRDGETTGHAHRIGAEIAGRMGEISFATTQLFPAVSSAIGPDVVLELRGKDQPVTVRSADRGDLTTVLMPTLIDLNNESEEKTHA